MPNGEIGSQQVLREAESGYAAATCLPDRVDPREAAQPRDEVS
ncbi:hypothetical protein [Pseudochelatococcus contaminans]|nr:hypothetical protein [Pseudochelatococcus contaminans]